MILDFKDIVRHEKYKDKVIETIFCPIKKKQNKTAGTNVLLHFFGRILGNTRLYIISYSLANLENSFSFAICDFVSL